MFGPDVDIGIATPVSVGTNKCLFVGLMSPLKPQEDISEKSQT